MVEGAWEQEARVASATRSGLWVRASIFAAAAVAAGLLIERDLPIVALALLVPAAVLTFADWLLRWRTMTYVLVITVLTIPVTVYRLPAELPFGLDIYRIVVIGMLALWFAALLGDSRIRWRSVPVGVPLFALFSVIGVSLLVNLVELEGGLGYGATVKRLFYFTSLVLLLYAIVSTVREPRDARRIVSFIIGVGVVLSLLGVVERFTTYNLFQHLESFVPLLKRTGAVSAAPLMRASGVRVSGSAAHPIAFAAILGMILPLPLARLSVAKDFVQQAAYALASCFIGVAMILTGSRTAFTGFIMVALVLVLGAGEGRSRLIATLSVVFVAVYIAVPGMLGTMFKWMSPSFIMQQEVGNPAGRLADYPHIMEYFWRRPLLGMGFGAFTPDRFFFVDNQYLKFLVEIGLAGLLAFAWFIWTSLRWIFSAARRSRGGLHADLLGIAASIAVFAAVCATFDTVGFPQVTYVFFILLSLGGVMALAVDARARDGQEEVARTVDPVEGVRHVPGPVVQASEPAPTAAAPNPDSS